jgi:hypothetical protein
LLVPEELRFEAGPSRWPEPSPARWLSHTTPNESTRYRHELWPALRSRSTKIDGCAMAFREIAHVPTRGQGPRFGNGMPCAVNVVGYPQYVGP